MYKIICDFCGAENIFSFIENKPTACSNQACQNSLEGLEINTFINEDVKQNIPDVKKIKELANDEKIVGLKLIYQKTSEELVISNISKIMLGRTNFGSDILGKISQISRAHCSIEFIDNNFMISDLNSTNGTFVGLGIDKISCLTPQKLKDKDFLVLGQEVFLVQLLKEETLHGQEIILQNEPIETKETEKNLCTECSFILTTIPCSCPECGTWNE